MFNSISHLTGAPVTATDGPVGTVTGALFDPHNWTIRYLLVDTGTWLAGRKLLVSPLSIRPPPGEVEGIELNLSRAQLKGSPDIDTTQPLSGPHERELARYYGHPTHANAPSGQVCSSLEVTGYEVHAIDESIGHAKDFFFEEDAAATASWRIRYLLVDTENWWPGGRKVLLATAAIARIDRAKKRVHVALTGAQVKTSPEYHELVTDRVDLRAPTA